MQRICLLNIHRGDAHGPSSSNPGSSLTAWDSVSSWRTLQIMFWVTVLFVPLIAVYTCWVYAKLRGTITLETIRSED